MLKFWVFHAINVFVPELKFKGFFSDDDEEEEEAAEEEEESGGFFG